MKRVLASLVSTLLALSLYGSSVNADDLVKNAKTTNIGNTPDGTASFFVRTTGGSGPCTNGVVIVFPESLVANTAIHNRAYTPAVSAFTTGKQNVRIATLESGNANCRQAGYIDLTD